MKIIKFHLKYTPLKYHFPSLIFKTPTKHNVALLIYLSSVWTSWKHDCHLSRNSCHLKCTLRENAQKTMAAIVIYQIIQHNEAVSKSHDIYSRINSSQQAIKNACFVICCTISAATYFVTSQWLIALHRSPRTHITRITHF